MSSKDNSYANIDKKTLFLSDYVDNESIGKLHKILKVQQHLKKIEYMMTTSRSRIFSKLKHDEHTGLWYGGEYILDAVSSKEIQAAITAIVKERYKALDAEIEKL